MVETSDLKPFSPATPHTMSILLRRLALSSLFVFTLLEVAQAQTNVLLVLADDLGVDQVSVYAEGTDPPMTPNIDALAQG